MRTVLTINDDGFVDLSYQENGVTIEKKTTIAEVAKIFVLAMEDEAAKEEEWWSTPFLPEGTISYEESMKSGHVKLVLSWGPEVLPFVFENTLYRAIPYPRLVFKMGLRKKDDGYVLHETYIVATKEKGRLTADTPLFKYPYSHVDWNTRMCMGLNNFPAIKTLDEACKLPRHVLTIPNLDHYYSNDTNLSGMVLRELLETLDGQKEFPEEWLAPLPYKLGDWVAR